MCGDDPGVNVDAYAYGLRDADHDTREKQCTVLRVTFAGWTAARVRAVIGGSAEQWCTLEETHLDGPPASVSDPDTKQYRDPIEVEIMPSNSPSLLSVDVDSTPASELELDETSDEDTWGYGLGLSQSPTTASASAQHEFVVPTLDFSSSFAEVVHAVPPPPQPEMFLRTASELARGAAVDGWSLVSSPSSLSPASSLSLSEGDEFPFTQGSGMRAMEASWDSPSMGLKFVVCATNWRKRVERLVRESLPEARKQNAQYLEDEQAGIIQLQVEGKGWQLFFLDCR
jgi:hypothetical protein